MLYIQKKKMKKRCASYVHVLFCLAFVSIYRPMILANDFDRQNKNKIKNKNKSKKDGRDCLSLNQSYLINSYFFLFFTCCCCCPQCFNDFWFWKNDWTWSILIWEGGKINFLEPNFGLIWFSGKFIFPWKKLTKNFSEWKNLCQSEIEWGSISHDSTFTYDDDDDILIICVWW